MYEWAALGITVVILVLLAIRKPIWLVPLLVLAVALEISSTWYPNLGMVSKILGMVSLTRLTSFALILAAFTRLILLDEMSRKLSAVLKDPLTIILIIFIAFGGISVVYSADPGKTLIETVRLLTLFAVFISIALLMDKEHALIPFKAIHFAAIALAPIAFYEGFTGNLLWQAEHLLQESTLRVNATFVDPNIFARFLILGVVANFILQIYTRDSGTKLIYMAGLAVLLAQLALTGSRGGMITLVVILIAALIFLPNRKAPLWVLGLGILFGGLILMGQPELWNRILSVTDFTNTQRLYLWKAAVAMFLDHPVIGTGLGTFQTVFESDYIHLRKDVGPAGATISHTTILTIAAELGAVGLAILTAIWVIILGKLYILYGMSHDYRNLFYNFRNEYFLGTGYFLLILTVFISSQGEGRFFEDPMVWLSLALLIILKFTRGYDLNLD